MQYKLQTQLFLAFNLIKIIALFVCFLLSLRTGHTDQFMEQCRLCKQAMNYLPTASQKLHFYLNVSMPVCRYVGELDNIER
jgi:hypothetical protein